MELDMNCINRELNYIITNKKRYNSDIILYAMATLELISTTKNTKMVSFKFIKLLTYLRKYLNCSIDFDVLTYLCNCKKNIIVQSPNTSSNSSNSDLTLSSSDSISSINSDDLNAKIDNMVYHDTNMLHEIINKEEKILQHDQYGFVDKKLLTLTKKLFNLIDSDKDGYISALDAIHILEISKKYPLIFENNFDDTIVELLSINKKVDFYSFFKHLY